MLVTMSEFLNKSFQTSIAHVMLPLYYVDIFMEDIVGTLLLYTDYQRTNYSVFYRIIPWFQVINHLYKNKSS